MKLVVYPCDSFLEKNGPLMHSCCINHLPVNYSGTGRPRMSHLMAAYVDCTWCVCGVMVNGYRQDRTTAQPLPAFRVTKAGEAERLLTDGS